MDFLSSCLQPQNILLTSLTPLGDIKIVDFGLARRLGSVGELREIVGTPEYVGTSWFKRHQLSDSVDFSDRKGGLNSIGMLM